jgi:hypothetical protein
MIMDEAFGTDAEAFTTGLEALTTGLDAFAMGLEAFGTDAVAFGTDAVAFGTDAVVFFLWEAQPEIKIPAIKRHTNTDNFMGVVKPLAAPTSIHDSVIIVSPCS